MSPYFANMERENSYHQDLSHLLPIVEMLTTSPEISNTPATKRSLLLEIIEDYWYKYG